MSKIPTSDFHVSRWRPGFQENMDVSSPVAIEKLVDRKRTQPMITSTNVVTFRRAIGQKASIASLYRVATNSRPWYAPQTTNVQLAPCQSPPSSIVIIRLRQVLHSPFRFPPRGM